jgi:hypothetical protein
VKPSSERVYLWADVIAERGVGERIPRLGEEIRELLSPDPFHHVRHSARSTLEYRQRNVPCLHQCAGIHPDATSLRGYIQTGDLMDGREMFKLTFLVDVAFDDFLGLWEPVRRLRRSRPELADEQAALLAESVLVELLDSGLIYLFRAFNEDELERAIADPARRFSRRDAEREIRSNWWRPVLPTRADVWVAATDEGEAAALAFEAGESPS